MQEELVASKITTSQKPKLAFVGLGWIGKNRMEAIINHQCAKVSCILEPDELQATSALEVAGDALSVTDFNQILDNPDIDGVVIATPSALHASQSIQALQSGKAVFCQKPLGRTAKEVEEVVNAAKTANKLLMVDLSYRYTKAVQSIYPLISNGELGEIFGVNLTFHNAYGPDKPWFYDILQSGGGCVMDLGIHLVDLALWSLNFPEIAAVQSSLYHQGEKLITCENHVEDFAHATILTAKGTTINLQCSWNVSAGKDAVIEASFFGTKGGASFRNINGSFYDFIAEKYEGTRTIPLASPPDDWGGKAGVIWAKKLAQGEGFNERYGKQLINTAQVLDRIYGR